MSDARNPYAPTNVPLETQGGAQGKGAYSPAELQYSTFWRRFGAAFLDGLILVPLSVVVYVGLEYTRLFYLYWAIPGLAITGAYMIYLVKRNGGTPGKRILDMKVVMLDGSPVTTQAAVLRYSVQLVIGAFSSLGLAIAGLHVSDAEFTALGYFEKIQLLAAHAPKWNMLVTWAAQGWYLVAAIVMLCNSRRRATHDFLAGTVVIRTK
jgi:uncharacterized RDD family membrane protein YckC